MSGEKTWCAGGGIKLHTEGGSFKLDSRLCYIVTKCMNPLKTQDQPPWLPVLVSLFGQSSHGSDEGLWRSISGSWGATDHVLNESWSEGMRLELVRTGGVGSHLKARVMRTEACGAAPNRLWLWWGGEGGWSFKSLHSPPVKLLPVCENKAGFRLATQESAQPQGDFRRK